MQPQLSSLGADPIEHRKLVAEIQELLLEKLSIRVESADADLLEASTFDSMALVHLLIHLERHFGLNLPLETLGVEPFRSVTKIADLIASLK